ncbi:Two component system histidine kinase, PAS and HAMP domains-containing [Desulfonema magnum]|uniref:histidine kinase n=2 Tax=Desulfonema magnum TaxID=45655 RepID=A0A975GTM6_9BACT|nr:Two component system histidine kinase, PAS and HAMP domains-containing [Desulfonema magnum]
MTAKILLLNLIIFIVFGIIIGVMVLAFRDIGELTDKIIDREARQIIHNAGMAREISGVFDRANMLIGTFYKNEALLKTNGDILLNETERLSSQKMDEKLKKSLTDFKTRLELFLKQCARINDISKHVHLINDDLTNSLAKMDNIISEKIILLITEEKDVSDLRQLSILIPSYREYLLKVNLQFAALETLRSEKNAETICALLAELHLRLRTLLTFDPQVLSCKNNLLNGVSEYEKYIAVFNDAVTEFHIRLTELNRGKQQIIGVMENLNKEIINKFHHIHEKTKKVMRSSMYFVYILSGTVIILFGVLTYIFFLLNIRKPMELICQELESVGNGDFDARIRLERVDEWSVIEQSLNKMVSEIWDSYSELYLKNEQLQKMHKELEATATYLEAEVAERKRTEKKLWKSQQYIKNIIDFMPSAMIGVDNEGRVTHWNMAAEKVVGISAEEAQNKFVTDVYPELDPQMNRIRRSLTDLRPLKAEKQIRLRQDEICYDDIMIYPLAADGEEGAVIRIDDVTSRVRIEEMMIQTEKMMSVGGLAAGMAHEINNPLGVILQGTQNTFRRLSPELEVNLKVARECGTDLETIRSYLKKRSILRYMNGIKDAGTRAAKIVTNMLNFSRQSEANMVPTNINKLLDNTIELAANDYDLKKKYDFRYIVIIRDYAHQLTEVPCIVTEIEQVILNLLRNSAQAMAEIKERKNTSKIILRTKREAEHVQIEIQDNGPGMDEKIRTRIFEPFFTTKTVGLGTGLGLSVSYFIITKNHRGTMSVESEPGRGAKFIIRLPLTRTPPNERIYRSYSPGNI